MGAATQIPLMTQPVQIASPLQTVGSLMQLKASMTENALRQAQTEQAQQQTQDLAAQAQLRQQGLRDQQTIMAAMKDRDTAFAIGSGDTSSLDGKVSPNNLIAFKTNVVKYAQEKAALRGTNLANDATSNAVIQKSLEGIQALPTDQARAEAYPSVIAALQAQGHLDHIKAPIPQSITGNLNELKSMEANLGFLSGITEHALSLAKTQAETQEAAGKGTEAAAAGRLSTITADLRQKALSDPGAGEQAIDGVLPASVDPAANASYKAAYRAAMATGGPDAVKGILDAAAAHSASLSPTTRGAKVSDAIREQVGVQRALEQISPQGQEIAKGIANYQMPPLASFAMARPQGQAIMAEVERQNPQYQAENYAAYQATERDAVVGKMATSANALNTMMGHLGVLNNSVNALENGNLQLLNHIANAYGAQTGSDAKTVYDTIVHRIGLEVTKAYIAAGGTAGERGTNEEDFSSNLSPRQIKSNIGISAMLADSKIAALQDQYQRGTYGHGQQRLISPEAEAARQQLAGQAPGGGAGASVKAPNGKTNVFKDQALADAFKKKAGIQ